MKNFSFDWKSGLSELWDTGINAANTKLKSKIKKQYGISEPGATNAAMQKEGFTLQKNHLIIIGVVVIAYFVLKGKKVF